MRIKDKVVERPQHMLMRVALGIHGWDWKDAIQTYEFMSQNSLFMLHLHSLMQVVAILNLPRASLVLFPKIVLQVFIRIYRIVLKSAVWLEVSAFQSIIFGAKAVISAEPMVFLRVLFQCSASIMKQQNMSINVLQEIPSCMVVQE